MIDVYSWATPNGHKIHIMLEELKAELGVDYNVHAVDIGKGDQFKEDFLKISPNNKIPAMIDHDGVGGAPISIFESGAILLYLAEKYDRFYNLSNGDKAINRYKIMEWLMFQMGGVGPMLGQNHHFRTYAPEKIAYAIDRYTNEASRIYGVIDKRLSQHAYIAGDSYSIADMAIFPWIRSYERQGMDLHDFPHVKQWFDGIAARPAVQKGVEVLTALRPAQFDAQANKNLFGNRQYERK